MQLVIFHFLNKIFFYAFFYAFVRYSLLNCALLNLLSYINQSIIFRLFALFFNFFQVYIKLNNSNLDYFTAFKNKIFFKKILKRSPR